MLVEAAGRVPVRLKGGKLVTVNQREYSALKSRGELDQGQRDPNFEKVHPRARKGAPTGGQFIRSGASGDTVRAVQRKVATSPDGQFGSQTAAAVRRYQRQHGLTVDGVVGRQTAAALLGNSKASSIAVGALTADQRRRLAERGKPKRKGSSRIVEAVAIASFLERVRGLEPGEHARLPDGGAVKHFMTTDGRTAWASGRPVTWRDDGMDWGETRRSPEEAVSDAFTASAGRTDPESLGGTTAFYRYSPITVNGQAAELVRVDENGQPVIRLAPERPVPDFATRGSEPEKTVAWPSLTRITR